MGAETVTLLFTDLVDSTALASRLGEKRGEALRQVHFSLLRRPILDRGGREIKNLGDGLMVAFHGVHEAVACAVTMQQRVERHNRRSSGPALGVRMGIAIGDAVVEDGDYFGTPVIEASRLCAQARGGQIVVSELVRLLCAGTDHRFEPLGPLELKGLPEPVVANAVSWTIDEGDDGAEGRAPLPPRLQATNRLPFIGRAREREVLDEAAKRAAEGCCELVLISGEPGAGKTRLAGEVARSAHRYGAVALFGGADEDLNIPHRPFVDALSHLATHLPDEVAERVTADHGADLARLVPELARWVPERTGSRSADPETERYQLFQAIDVLLAAASDDELVVLVLDDIQWADQSSLLLIRHLVRSGVHKRLLIIGTYRSSDLGRDHPLTSFVADLRREDRVTRVPMLGLSDAEVVELLQAAAGHDLDDDAVVLAHVIRRETDGNPFFVVEILRHLRDSGLIREEDGRWQLTGTPEDLHIPESVREVIDRRLGRLDDEVRRVLNTAAVVGHTFELDVLCRLLDAQEERLLDALDAAAAAGLVMEDATRAGRFAFSHRLIRTALYDELGATRRGLAHRRVAEVLEELRPPDDQEAVTELAHHWFVATRQAEPSKAILYARRAGELALADLAYEEAATQLQRAVDLAGETDLDLRCQLLLILGDALRSSGDAGYRGVLADAFAIAEAKNQPERMGAAALRSARVGSLFASAGQIDHDLIDMYERTLGRLDETDSAMRAGLLAALAVELSFAGDRPLRVTLCDEAEAMARRVGDAAGLARVLSSRFVALWDPETLDARRALLEELGRLADELDNGELRLLTKVLATQVLVEAGEVEELELELADAMVLATQIRVAGLRWLLALVDSGLAILRGLPESEVAAVEALQLGQDSGQPDAFAGYGAQLFHTRWDQGRLEEILPLIEGFVDSMPDIPAWRCGLAVALLEVGRPDDARGQLDLVRDTDLPLDWVWMSGTTLIGEAAVELGDEELAVRTYERLLPFSDRMVSVASAATCFGPVSRVLAILADAQGQPDVADAWFGQAIETCDRFSAAPMAVRTRRAWAQALAARDGTAAAARAAELADEALIEGRRLGMSAEVRRLEALVQQRAHDGSAQGD